jgi:hypothetical protein
MKRLKYVVLLVVVLSLFVVATAFAGPAYNAAFTTSVTYQNVGAGEAAIVFNFYPENNGTAIPIARTLPAGAGSSLFVGGLNEIAAGFKGSVVMSSNEPVVATMVQISSDTAVKNRPLSNGFASGDSEVLLATVLKNQFNTTSRFSVQNASAGAVDLTVSFYNAAAPANPPIVVTHNNLPAGAAKYFDVGTLAQVPSPFNGSAIVSAKVAGTSTPADIVASVLELSTNGPDASSFEGVTGGAATVYMPSALCNAFGATSAYAVQNTSSTNAAAVTVTYSNGITQQANIAPGAKFSFNGCAAGTNGTNPAGFNGSSIVTSTGGDIVVIGKVFGSGNSTAFVGATSGASEIALPYVRFTTSQWLSGARQRAYIAVQNVGSDLAANQVTVSYINRDGAVVGIHTLGAMTNGAKLNSNPTHPGVVIQPGFAQADLNEFGYVGGFGGSALIEGPNGSELVAVVRIQSSTGGSNVVGEDYNGIPTN